MSSLRPQAPSSVGENPNPATISANAPTEASSSFVLLISPLLLQRLRRAFSRSRQSKTPAISKLMKIKENGDRSRSRSRESREFREFPRIPRIGVLESPRERPLAEFELLFVDSQGLDAGLEGRWWNSKLCRCSGGAGNPASSLSERRLDDFPLASRLNIQSRRRFSPRCLRRSPFGKP